MMRAARKTQRTTRLMQDTAQFAARTGAQSTARLMQEMARDVAHSERNADT